MYHIARYQIWLNLKNNFTKYLKAVIVSNDEYRDLVKENPRWRSVVENYLLMYSFVDGK